jgi:hypothetical protein
MMPHSLYNSVGRLKKISEYGGIKTQIILGTGSQLKMMDGGFLIAAVHFQRNYRGGMFTVFRES